MIEIDGSHHEGGGQIVRTAVGLSAFTGEAIKIVKIRANRPNPGLQAQHLAAIKAVATLCNAQVKGDSIGSQTLEFRPSREFNSEVHVTIPTAGSCGLVLQAVFTACIGIRKKTHIEIDGGATFGKWAPSIVYMQNVFLRAVERFGFSAKIEVLRHGFYPKGGAQIVCEIEPADTGREIKSTEFTSYSLKPRITGISIASRELEGRKVAERQARSAEKTLTESGNFEFGGIETSYEDTLCVGSGIVLWTDESDNGVFLGGSAIGERGKSSEEVGSEAATEIIEGHNKKGCTDKYLADQLIPFLGVFGGELKTTEITAHTETNIWTFERFFGQKGPVFEVNKSKNSIISKRKR